MLSDETPWPVTGPLAINGRHTDRHETDPPGMVEPRVQMKRPSRSAESEYRVIPREFTSTVVPSFGLGAVLTTSA